MGEEDSIAMRDNNSYILFSILRSVFCGNRMSHADEQPLIESSLVDIIKLAAKHDIAHLVAYGLSDNLKDENIKQQLQQIVFRAVYRFEKMNYEYRQVCNVLEQAEIPFIPLKGAVLREYYPEPWMRTSCDIDILVYEKDLKMAISHMVKILGYTEHDQGSHDVSLFSPSGVHVELHYDLVEDNRIALSSKILSNIWDVVMIKDDWRYLYEIPDDMFFFYHIAHMAKHFTEGGCGIRPFIDLMLLESIHDTDIEKRNILLERGALLKFANAVRKLSRVWFFGEEYDTVSKHMEEYILHGGVYGNNENRITIQQQKKGGKIKYALSKIVIPYDTIKFHYPILQKHRWLTPFMQIRRWFKLIFCGHAKRSMRELTYNSNISQSQADEMKIFLEEIGL
ncbi:MAG: hypothetical protein DBX61_03170 [Clostridiales bacterium]|nr:MAG: hypothetical protein DBX61_03170 [Clostridiales bacterium]